MLNADKISSVKLDENDERFKWEEVCLTLKSGVHSNTVLTPFSIFVPGSIILLLPCSSGLLTTCRVLFSEESLEKMISLFRYETPYFDPFFLSLTPTLSRDQIQELVSAEKKKRQERLGNVELVPTPTKEKQYPPVSLFSQFACVLISHRICILVRS